MGERLNGIEEVKGSNPFISTTISGPACKPDRAPQVKMVRDHLVVGFRVREVGRGFLISMRASGHYSHRYHEGMEETLALLAVYGEEHNWPPVADLTTTHLEEYLAYLQERPLFSGRPGRLSPKSVETHYGRINVFFTWLVDRGHVERHPMEKIPHPKVPERIIDIVTDRQKLALLELADPQAATAPGDRFRCTRNYALLYLLFDTPGRREEIATINVSGVDLEEGMVQVYGKGGRERRMPLGAVAIGALQEYLRARQHVAPRHIDALWVNEWGQPVQENWLYLTLRRLSLRAGVGPIHPHQFRHTYATLAIEGGMPLRMLEIIGGWRRIPATYLRKVSEEKAAEKHREISPGDRLRGGVRRGRASRGRWRL